MVGIKIHCHTNLDLLPADKMGWPDRLPEVPRVGDEIENKHRWTQPTKPGCVAGIDCRLRLKVVAVRWRYGGWQDGPEEGGGRYLSDACNGSDWYTEVELHIPSPYKNLIEFYELYYGPVTGKDKSFFI